MSPIDLPSLDPAARDDLSALAWVQAELRKSLETALKALRRFVRDGESERSDTDAIDVAPLRLARSHLHQGGGALELVGQPGAAAVLRAAEAAVQRCVVKPQLATRAAIADVERCGFAVLDYLGRLLAGKPVAPLALFPQYAAAQALAGAERVHPADLWTNDFRWRALPVDPTTTPRAPDDAARGEMESLVLATMRAADPAAVRRMSDLCAALGAGARAAGTLELATLWQLAAAFFEAQAAGRIGVDVHTKRVASRLLSVLRAVRRGSADAPTRLAQDMLFYGVRAEVVEPGATPRLAALQRVWPPDPAARADYETASLGLHDPGQVLQARKRVSAAKDVWSMVAGGEPHRLPALHECFTLVADSVQRLFPGGETLAPALLAAVQQVVDQGEPPAPAPALAMEVATSILYLDAVLEDGELDQPVLGERVRRLAQRVRDVAGAADPEPLEQWMEELYRRISDRQTMGSVVHELRASLSEIEKHVDPYFRDPRQRELLIPVPAQLSAMRGVFSVLGLDEASHAVVRMRDEVDALVQPDVDPQHAAADGAFDRLADNLGALSFLIDMLGVQPQLAKSLFRYDADRGRLCVLMGRRERDSQFAALAPDVVPSPPSPAAVPVPGAAATAGAASAPSTATPTDAAGAGGVPAAELADDLEMREVFLEEAREVAAAARASLDALDAQPDDVAEMTAVRRAFHTLKGSGRMVGLHAFGEAAWACEQLYNARLASSATMEPSLLSLSRAALAYLDGWVDAIAAGVDRGHTAAAVVGPADALRTAGTLQPIEPPPERAPESPAVGAAGRDPTGATGVPGTITTPAEAEGREDAERDRDGDTTEDETSASPSGFGGEGPPSASTQPPAGAVDAASVLVRMVPGLPSAADLDLLTPADLPTPPEAASPVAASAATAPLEPTPIEAAWTDPTPPGSDRDAYASAEAERQGTPTSLRESLAFTLDLEALDAVGVGPLGADGHGVPPTAEATAVEPTAEAVPAAPPLSLRAEPAPPTDSSWVPVEAPEPWGVSGTPPAASLPDATERPAAGPVAGAPSTLSFDDLADAFAVAEPLRTSAPEPVLTPTPSSAEAAGPAAVDGGVPGPTVDDRIGGPPDDDARPGAAEGPASLPAPSPAIGDDRVVDARTADETAGAIAEAASTPPTDAPVADGANEVAADGFGTEPVAHGPAEVVPLVPADDPVKIVGPLRIPIPLFNIFLNEADEQSRRLGVEIAEWALEPQHAVGESTIALAHSIAGNSATVGYHDLSSLARSLEHALARSRAHGRARGEEPLLFNDAADEIRRLLHQFAAGFLKLVPPSLRARLAAHEAWPVEAPAEAGDSSHAVLDVAAPVTGPQDPDGPADHLSPAEEDALPEGVVDAVDSDLFPIFDEEAEELLPQLRSRLSEWIRRPSDSGAAAACMRTLHTFKGGARLAGAMRVGEMAHRLETEIERLGDASDVTASQVERLLMRADAMAHALERLRHPGVAPEVAPGLATPGNGPDGSPSVTPMPEAPDSSAPASALPAAGAVDGVVAVAVAVADGGPSPLDATPAADGGTAAPALPKAADADPAQGATALSDASPAPTPAPRPADGPAPRIDADPSPVTHAAVADGASAPTTDDGPPIDWSRFVVVPEPDDAAAADAAAAAAPSAAAAPTVPTVRVRAPLLDRLVNEAGEVSITRARIEAEMRTLHGSLDDLTDNLERLRRHLRDIELHSETQIATRLEAAKAANETFDPLEMDRYTRFQELTRMMAESVNDVATVQRSLQRALQSSEDELAMQARLTRDLQDDLLRTRMVEFESLADRLYRVVRAAGRETGKAVRLDLIGGGIEVDRSVLERMVGPFEHLLRNSVAHGIEASPQRVAAGKDETGTVTVTVQQEGNEVAVEVRDDGAGLDLGRIHRRAVERGLVAADAALSDDGLADLIFLPGFSTADAVSGLAGRGVGMDVVRAEVTAMGGRIETRSQPGQGTAFRLLLPLTTAVTQVVMLRCGEREVAVPSTVVESVRRVRAEPLEQAYASGSFEPEPGAAPMPFHWLGGLLQAEGRPGAADRSGTVVVMRSAGDHVAVHVDEVVGHQEVVVKNVGPQLVHLPGLAGVTLLPSGAVALIYNPVALSKVYGAEARERQRQTAFAPATPAASAPDVGGEALPPLVLVVDDSLTVRRVTQRLLQREGYRVALAKDGLEAIEKLAGERPAVLLSDIEMPRMDGFDLVRNVRADTRLAGLPVIMITSRIAQKHRDVAAELGVDHYLGKPYAEDELLALVARHTGADVRL